MSCSERYLPMVLIAMLLSSAAAAAPPPDLSSPVATVKSLHEAIEAEDEARIRAVFFAESDAQRDLADAYAKLVVAGKRLADAAKARFAGAADALAQGVTLIDQIEQLESAVVEQITDDTATLKLSRSARPIAFRRGASGWQIDLMEFSPTTPERIAEQVDLTRNLAEAFTELAGEITAGKYVTVQDAETAIQQRLNEVTTRALRKRPPATAPATSPAQ